MIIRPNTALQNIVTIPVALTICKLHRIAVDASRDHDEHSRQRARDTDTLARRSVRVVEFAHEFVLIVVDLDIEAVVIRAAP